MSDKTKFPLADAEPVAQSLLLRLAPYCERIVVAGSIRRCRPEVGDIELLFVPKMQERTVDFFEKKNVSLADEAIEYMLNLGLLKKRPSKVGAFTWGPCNKLAVHVESGIPVDLFASIERNWWNALVCRTGGKENNLLITTTARRRGWTFEAYGSGFASLLRSDTRHDTTSERNVFEFLGLPYKEPWERK
jgi:DNA polymerase/3'-5' exonuclease PolX